MTIFEKSFSNDQLQIQRVNNNDPALTKDESMVATFSHEIDHDINQRTIQAVKIRQAGGRDGCNVEAPAYQVTNKVLDEIKKMRN